MSEPEITLADVKAEADATAAELAAHEAADKAPQKPSMGRIVIFRDAAGVEAPAIVTRIYPSGAVALHVFRDDASATHSYGAQTEIDPGSTGESGWYFPPRV